MCALAAAALTVAACGGADNNWRRAANGAPDHALSVSVATSLSDIMNGLARHFELQGGHRVAINAGASNTLARQIVEGAPVDLFISADDAQMDLAARSGRLVDDSRVELLTNQLTVIASPDVSVHLERAQDLAHAAVRRIAMGEPSAVPAGVYARGWLERAGLWQAVQPKLIPMPTVRAALAAVREGRADVGIVFVTDARSAGSDVRVAFAVPSAEAPRIVYPAAVLKGPRQAEAMRFLDFLQSPDSRAAFEAAGFGTLGTDR